MNLVLFIVTIAISFIVVRIGAIAFEITGLDWPLAKFQALSCFTGTGFTTKESELITGNPTRRKIATILMVLGSANFVTLVATLANSMSNESMVDSINFPFLDLIFPSYLLFWVKLLIIIMFIIFLFYIHNKTHFTRKLTSAIRKYIIKKELIKPVSFEELVIATGGYGVSSIEINFDSPLLNKSLKESNLRDVDINILAIERDEQTIPNPKASTKIILGDRLICFGKLDSIKNKLLSR